MASDCGISCLDLQTLNTEHQAQPRRWVYVQWLFSTSLISVTIPDKFSSEKGFDGHSESVNIFFILVSFYVASDSYLDPQILDPGPQARLAP